MTLSPICARIDCPNGPRIDEAWRNWVSIRPSWQHIYDTGRVRAPVATGARTFPERPGGGLRILRFRPSSGRAERASG